MPRNHRFRFFLAPDDGAPSGGGGGNTPAVLDGPIQPAGGETFDPSTYTPPSDVDISDFVLGDGSEAPAGTFEPKPTQTPPKEEKPTEEKKEEPPKEEAKKPEQKKEPPAAQLRNELKKYQEKTSELEKRSAELEKQLEEAKTNKEAQELRHKLEANEKRIADIEKEKSDYERKLLAHNPHASKRLNDLRETFNREWQETVEMVPSLAQNYQSLLNEFASIPRGTPEGNEQLREFQQKIRDEYDFDAERVYTALRKGIQFRSDYARTADEVQRDAEKFIFEQQKQEWETNFKRVDSEWNQWFTPPADAETNDPFNAMLFLQKFTKEVLPAEENTRLDKTIQDYVKQVVAGAQPRTKDDFPGMSDEQISADMKAIEQRVSTARQKLPEVLAKSMKLAAMTGPLIKEISRLRSRLKEQDEAQPPDPTKKDGVSQKRTGGNETSLDDLDIPNPYAIEQSVMRGA